MDNKYAKEARRLSYTRVHDDRQTDLQTDNGR